MAEVAPQDPSTPAPQDPNLPVKEPQFSPTLASDRLDQFNPLRNQLSYPSQPYISHPRQQPHLLYRMPTSSTSSDTREKTPLQSEQSLTPPDRHTISATETSLLKQPANIPDPNTSATLSTNAVSEPQSQPASVNVDNPLAVESRRPAAPPNSRASNSQGRQAATNTIPDNAATHDDQFVATSTARNPAHSSEHPLLEHPQEHMSTSVPSPSPSAPDTAENPFPPPSREHLHQNQGMYNMVTSFGEMSISPMQYTPSVPLIPIQPHPSLSLPPPHSAHVTHQRHSQHIQQQQTYCLWVPQDRVGAVIGGNGAVIKSLQERSGATIQVHNGTVRAEHKLFTICGTQSEYEAAARLVNEIVERPRPSGHASSSIMSEKSRFSSTAENFSRGTEVCRTVYVPTSCVGLVIGRNGETIRNLQDKSGADIKVTPDEEAHPGADTRSILISGTKEGIAHAHQLVSEIVMEARSRRPHHLNPPVGSSMNGQPVIMEVLAIPNDKVGLIIGKKGVTIRDLQQKSGAKIQVTKDDNFVQSDGSRPVTIVGIRSHVDDAKALIANKINVAYLPSSPASFQSPGPVARNVPQPPTPGHTMPYVYHPHGFDGDFQNGQPQFHQPFESGDPNAQNRTAMAYFPYMGFNNMAAMAQQPRPFPPPMTLQYGHQQLQQEAPGIQTSGPESHESPTQPQFASPTLSHSQPLEGIPGSPPLMPRDHNGNVIMYPGHPYPPLPHMHGQQVFPPPPNARIYPRDHAQVVHAQAQAQAHAHMMMHAQAQAQAQIQAQAQAQAQAVQTQAPAQKEESAADQPTEATEPAAPIQGKSIEPLSDNSKKSERDQANGLLS